MIEIYNKNSELKSDQLKTINSKYSFYKMFQNEWLKSNINALNKNRSQENKIQLKDFKELEKKITLEMCYS
jgi:hypothetical protein